MREDFEKKKHFEIDDKAKKYILRGQKNVGYYDRILSNKKKSFNLNNRYWFCQFSRAQMVIDTTLNLSMYTKLFDGLSNDVSHFVVA